MSTHRHLCILLSLVLALAALLLLLLSLAVTAAISAHEAMLNPDGLPYEVNADSRGDLWISDSGANEIWQVNPPTGAYTVYQGLSIPCDARRDGGGMVWWTDAGSQPALGCISITAGTVTTWTLLGAGRLLGLAFAEDGLVWAADAGHGQIWSLAPGHGQLCAYPLPDGGASDYVVFRDAAVWLGD